MSSKCVVRIKLNRYGNVYCEKSEFILAAYLTISVLLTSYDVGQIDTTAAKSQTNSAQKKHLDNRT
jgi:hypothetical protein